MPLLGDVHQRQVEQLDRSVFIGEGAAGLDHLAQSHVQGLYRVGGVNDFSNIGREREEGHDLLPVPAPELADRAVFGIPFGGKGLQLLLGILAADGSVDQLQIGHHGLGILPAHEPYTGPHHVHDAQLYGGLRIGRLNGLRKPFNPSTHAMKMSSTPRVFNSLSTLSQNLAPSLALVHSPSTSLWPSMVMPMAT